MSRPSAILGILKIAAASGGEIDTRIRLQKEAYLLAVCRLGRFDASDFEYHHYGPYSRAVSDALRFAVSAGYLDETAEYIDDNQSSIKYSYNITPLGRDLLGQVNYFEPEIEDLIGYLSRQPWRSLELAATVRFLEDREGIEDREVALAEAIRLKPATKGFQTQARAVLQRV